MQQKFEWIIYFALNLFIWFWMERINLICRMGVMSKGYVHLKTKIYEMFHWCGDHNCLVNSLLLTVRPFRKSSPFCVQIAFGHLQSDSQIWRGKMVLIFCRTFVAFFFHTFYWGLSVLGIVHIWLCTGEFLLVTAYITEMPSVRGETLWWAVQKLIRT